jgi:multimeric flavodoxin WrbA
MTKYLFISGSPRKGNTEFALSKIYESLDAEKDLILLREKNIKHCQGCLGCHENPVCAINDDMKEILEKMKWADVLIIGSPNYFENITGLLKDFMDRTHPLYKQKLIKGKKIALIFVGGGEEAGTEKFLKEATYGFVKHLGLDLIGVFIFRALEASDLQKDNEQIKIIDEVILNKLQNL